MNRRSSLAGIATAMAALALLVPGAGHAAGPNLLPNPGFERSAFEPAVRLVVSETRRLNDLVENLMEVTRFDAGTARLVLDDVLAHVAVLLLDAALGEVAGVAEVLAAGAARDAVIVRARAAHHRDHQVAAAEAGHAVAGLDHLAIAKRDPADRPRRVALVPRHFSELRLREPLRQRRGA